MPDVNKYGKRDAAAAETRFMFRRVEIARQLPGMRGFEEAVWLFCRWSGYRKVTDTAWFAKHMAKDETVEEFRLRLYCEACRLPGCLEIIIGPSSIDRLRIDFRKPEGRALLVSDRYL